MLNRRFPSLLLLLTILVSPFNSLSAQPVGNVPCDAIEMIPMNWNADCVESNDFLFTSIGTSDSGVPGSGCSNIPSVDDLWFTFNMPADQSDIEFKITSANIPGPYYYEIYEVNDCNNLGIANYCIGIAAGYPLILSNSTGNPITKRYIRFWDESGVKGELYACLKKRVPNYNPNLGTCGNSPHAANECSDAIIWGAGLDGYCGNTENYTVGTSNVSDVFPAFIDNSAWVGFTALSDSVAIEIITDNCQYGNGTQSMIFATDDCQNFTPVSNMVNFAVPGTGVLIADNLIVGSTYYILIDGWGGDICDFTLNYLNGVPGQIDMQEDYAICTGESTALNIVGLPPGNYNYDWQTDVDINDRYSASPTVNPTEDKVYTCHITGDLDVMIDINVFVQSQQLEDFFVLGDYEICGTTNNAFFSAQANYADEITWAVNDGGIIIGNNFGSTVEFDVLSDQITVYCTASNACGSITYGYDLQVYTEPELAPLAPIATCDSTFNLSELVLVDSTSVGGIISYYSNESDASAGQNPLTDANVTQTGNYWVRKETSEGCFDIQSILIEFSGLDLTIWPVPVSCNNDSIQLTDLNITINNGGMSPALSYFNSQNDAENNQNALTQTLVAPGATYYVRLENLDNNCSVIQPVEIAELLVPAITFPAPFEFCIGESIDLGDVLFVDANNSDITEILFFDNLTFAQIGLATFSLTNLVITDESTLYVRFTTAEGCFVIETIEVNELNLPIADFTFTNIDNEYVFSGNVDNGTTITWDFGDGNFSNEINPTHEYQNSGIYEVVLTVENSCGGISFSESIQITISSIAQIEGIDQINIYPNPSTGIFQLSIEGYTSSSLDLEVYDYLGQRIRNLSFDNIRNSNGAFNLEGLPVGIYFLKISDQKGGMMVEKLQLISK